MQTGSEGNPRRLHELTAREVERLVAQRVPVLLPVGAIEQHGDYLPLGTDTLAAIAVAEGVSARTGAVVGPEIWWGFSPHHMWRPGTITLRPEILAGLIVDVCGSLASHGFVRVIVINGHRVANLPPLQIGLWQVAEAYPDTEFTLVDLQDLAEPLCNELAMLPFGHGDECETAHLLHLRGDLVDRDAIPQGEPEAVGGEERLPPAIVPVPPPRIPGRRPERATSGYPVRATAENGARLQQAMVDRVVGLLR